VTEPDDSEGAGDGRVEGPADAAFRFLDVATTWDMDAISRLCTPTAAERLPQTEHVIDFVRTVVPWLPHHKEGVLTTSTDPLAPDVEAITLTVDAADADGLLLLLHWLDGRWLVDGWQPIAAGEPLEPGS
jgi:hypothetical protein